MHAYFSHNSSPTGLHRWLDFDFSHGHVRFLWSLNQPIFVLLTSGVPISVNQQDVEIPLQMRECSRMTSILVDYILGVNLNGDSNQSTWDMKLLKSGRRCPHMFLFFMGMFLFLVSCDFCFKLLRERSTLLDGRILFIASFIH